MRVYTFRVAVVTLLLFGGIHAETPKETVESKPARPARKVLVKRTPVTQAPVSATLAPAAELAPATEGSNETTARLSRSAPGADRWQRFGAGERGNNRDRHGSESRPAPRDGNRFERIPEKPFKTEPTSFNTKSVELPDWIKGIVRVDLPVGHLDSKLSPVILLPVPVRDNSCDANKNKPDRYSPKDSPSYADFPSRGSSRRTRPPPASADDDDYEDAAPAPAPRPKPYRPSRPSRPQAAYQPDREFGSQQTYNVPPPVVPGVPSHVLIEQFRAQQPLAPHLPPVLIRDRRYGSEEPARPVLQPVSAHTLPSPSLHVELPAASLKGGLAPKPFSGNKYLAPLVGPDPTKDLLRTTPPQPRFDRPLMVRGELTVHRADHTEPYTAWWDAASGAATMDMHEGTTSMYRMVSSGGQVKRAVISLDRSGETDIRRCTVMPQSSLTPADQIPPVLPDTKDFSFKGFVQHGEVRAEMWKQIVAGASGDGGASGEALTYRHELMVMRAPDNSAIPLQYAVAVDSSVLGADCDGYVHRYHEVREEQRDPQHFQIDLARTCDQTEETEDVYKVEPLREFTMLQRAPHHTTLFKGFISEFGRKYVDSAEEAVRMNLFMQTSRFIASANRIGATFKTAVNFLADRLDQELQLLLGVVLDDEHFPAESFPHARSQLRDIEAKLPKEFDWRERGGVTRVKYQDTTCASCWAFAVAGAVEGALFRRTRKLVPLSEQCLVDCAQPYGGRGCDGTWPSHAYDYVQDRGLPAEDEYTPYQAKVLECQDKRVPPVTLISAHVNVTQFSVPALKVAIRRHAPSVVIIDGALKSFQTYKSGVFYDDRCHKAKNMLKHAVLAVGWGEQKGETHFILKNSWSAAWGEGGYIRMHAPSNTCGVLTLPSYPRLETADVLRQPGADTGLARDKTEPEDYD